MEHIHGLLRIHVRREFNLRHHLQQPLRWQAETEDPSGMTIVPSPIIDPALPIHLMVYDKDKFSSDDKDGDADIHIGLFLEALRNAKMGGLPVGTVFARIQPSRDICLAEESCIVQDDQGGLTQSVILRQRNVESGKVELKLQWIDVPGSRGDCKRLRASSIWDLHAYRMKGNSVVS